MAVGRSLRWLVAVIVLSLGLGGCVSNYPAPVSDRALKSAKYRGKRGEPDWRPNSYVVQKGDTLYSIALEYGFDYREIAEWNGVDDPNRILVGQELRLKPPAGVVVKPLQAQQVTARPPEDALPAVVTQPKALKQPYSDQALAKAQKPSQEEAKPQVAKVEEKPEPKVAEKAEPADKPDADAGDDEAVKWAWPANGKVLAGFGDGGSKGVDIGGKLGQPVVASADGKVVYSGSGLRGYGKLIIIKHNKTYLSAYAHNSRILVKEGQTVTKGQKIGEMGSSDTDRVKLHFEIRRLGKPVDPLKYLNEKS